jgi:hypothetical protein
VAKRKSNRAARALLCVAAPGPEDCYRISNRRWQVYSANYPHVWQHVKPSRSQRRAEALEPEIAECPGCDKHGELNQKNGGFYCYGSDRCCP